MTNDESAWITLKSRLLSASVNPLGAQLSTLRTTAGHDLLWGGDPAFWGGRAPWLFPIVGELAQGQYRLNNRSYALSRHGFARGKAFTVLEHSASRAAFELKDDAGTLAAYPFHFTLIITFVLRDAQLTIESRIHNPNDVPMPASYGFHPAFRWPLAAGEPRHSYYIEFEREETAPIRRLNKQGLLTPIAHPTPIRGRRLELTDGLFTDDAMILDQLASRSVTYGGEWGPRIQVSFPDCPYLGIWSKPNAPFVCIEPWHGLADPEGFTGDFSQKPGVFQIAPASHFVSTVTIGVV